MANEKAINVHGDEEPTFLIHVHTLFTTVSKYIGQCKTVTQTQASFS